MKKLTKKTAFPLLVTALVAALAFAGVALADDPPATTTDDGSQLIEGQVLRVREQVRTRDGSRVDEVVVRTRDGERVRLRLDGAGEASRLGLRKGDPVRAEVEAGEVSRRTYRVRSMRNERSGEELTLGNTRTMTRQQLRDGSGAGGQHQYGSGNGSLEGRGGHYGTGGGSGQGTMNRTRTRTPGSCAGSGAHHSFHHGGGGGRGRR